MLHRHCGVGIARATPPPALHRSRNGAAGSWCWIPAWARSVHQALLAGDRAEAQDLLTSSRTGRWRTPSSPS